MSVALLVLVVFIGWQVGVCELANIELQDDMHDLASQLGFRIGYDVQKSEEELRDSVIRKAAEHGIELKSNQVTVRRYGSGERSTVYLAAHYSELIDIPLCPFTVDFSPSAGFD